MKTITVSSLVVFINPFPDEIGLVMKVLEVNGDRLLVESLVNQPINPTSVILAADVEIQDFIKWLSNM